jgi:hypothetical protein
MRLRAYRCSRGALGRHAPLTSLFRWPSIKHADTLAQRVATERSAHEELESLEQGQRVQYAERISSRNGKPEAVAVEPIADDEPQAKAQLAAVFGDR